MHQPTRSYFAVPSWVVSGLLGLALGVGGTFVGILNYQAAQNKTNLDVPAVVAANKAKAASSGDAPALAVVAAKKWNLASLVGKLEFLSRPEVNLHVDLTEDQIGAIAAVLGRLDQAKSMTGDEAQLYLSELDSVLTEEQKKALAVVVLPMGRDQGPSPVAGGGDHGPNSNPFSQHTNQERLQDLLKRLNRSGVKDERSDGKREPTLDLPQLPLNPLQRPLQFVAARTMLYHTAV